VTLALYRKYRPRTFAEVIGQEHVTEPLSQALRSGRLHHAYLFSGPRGCGKTSSARILARSLNCAEGPTPEPCGKCDSCRALAGDGAGAIDVIEIDAASHGGVDDARELRERAFFAPASSRFKIYVIDEAHMVSSAGFNALLKLVEEPPDYVKFIFATTEPEKVLGTIKSRTHHYPFRLIAPGVLRPYLEQLASAEGVKVEPAVFPLVVRAGGGSARDSLSVLDQLIAGAGPDGVSYARAVALLGVTDVALIDEMCDALAAGDGAAAYATIDRVAEAGHDPRRFAADLLERLRDLIVLQQVPDAAAKGLIDGPADQVERMVAQAGRLGPATLSRCADIVHNGLVEMRGTTAPRLLLELICARMLLPGAEDSTGGLLQRLERMERRLALAGDQPPPAAAGSGPATTPDPVRPAPAPAPAAPSAAGPSAAGPSAAAPRPAPRPAAATARSPGASPPASSPAAATAPSPPAPAQAPAMAPVESPPAAQAPARRAVPPEAVMPDPATPDPVRPGAEPPGTLDAAAVRRVWNDIVGAVNRSNKRIAALMRDAVVRDLDGDTLVLTVKSPVLAQMMAGHAEVLTDALYEELGGRWQIRCEVAGDQRGAAPATGSPAGPRSVPTAPPAGRTGGGTPAERVSVSRPAGDRGDTDWPEPARPGGAAPANPPGASEGDWPEPARPGGAAPAGPGGSTGPGVSAGPAGSAGANVSTGPGGSTGPGVSAGPGDSEGPGGSASPSVLAGPRGARASAPTVPAGSGQPGDRGPASGGSTNGASNSGVTGNGSTGANGRGNAAAGKGRVGPGLAAARAAAAGRGARTSAATRTADDGPAPTADRDWAGEPPYDPEFDGPPRGAASYEGFDPGDEPLDEVIDEKTARQTSEQQAVQLLQQTLGAERIGEIDAK
jgi:DNA polymerase-3 subunit gamma/tau